MIDLDTELADHVFRLLFLAAPAALMTERTLHLAMVKLDGDIHWYRPTEFIRFFTSDAVIFLMTLLASALAIVPAVNASSFGYVFDLLTTLRADTGTIGWAMSLLVWLHIIAPFAVALLLSIGRHRRLRQFAHLRGRGLLGGEYC